MSTTRHRRQFPLQGDDTRNSIERAAHKARNLLEEAFSGHAVEQKPLLAMPDRSATGGTLTNKEVNVS